MFSQNCCDQKLRKCKVPDFLWRCSAECAYRTPWSHSCWACRDTECSQLWEWSLCLCPRHISMLILVMCRWTLVCYVKDLRWKTLKEIKVLRPNLERNRTSKMYRHSLCPSWALNSWQKYIYGKKSMYLPQGLECAYWGKDHVVYHCCFYPFGTLRSCNPIHLVVGLWLSGCMRGSLML